MIVIFFIEIKLRPVYINNKKMFQNPIQNSAANFFSDYIIDFITFIKFKQRTFLEYVESSKYLTFKWILLKELYYKEQPMGRVPYSNTFYPSYEKSLILLFIMIVQKSTLRSATKLIILNANDPMII